MKALNKEQMNHVSGAGVDMLMGMEGYYKTYDDFSDYLSYAYKNNINPMYFKDTRQAFTAWCQEIGVDAVGTAKLNGWSDNKVTMRG